MQVLFIMAFKEYRGIHIVFGYVFRCWAKTIGWLLTFSSLVCIPAYMIYRFITTPGNINNLTLTLTRQ